MRTNTEHHGPKHAGDQEAEACVSGTTATWNPVPPPPRLPAHGLKWLEDKAYPLLTLTPSSPGTMICQQKAAVKTPYPPWAAPATSSLPGRKAFSRTMRDRTVRNTDAVFLSLKA